MKRLPLSLLFLLLGVILVFTACATIPSDNTATIQTTSDLIGIVDDTAYISLTGTIWGDSPNELWQNLLVLKRQGITKITLIVNSGGGSAFGCFAYCEMLDKAKDEGFYILGKAHGLVASAAVPIFAACSERIATPNTIFMVHKPPRIYADEDVCELFDMTDEIYVSLLAKYSDLEFEEADKKCNEFTWFSAKQAKRWGIVDRIE